MNLRTLLTAALGIGAFLLLGCIPTPPPPPAEEESIEASTDSPPGPLESHRAGAKFDPAARHFLHTINFFQVTPTMVSGVHKSYVEEFLRRPGAGFGRMGPPPSPSSNWVELVAESQADRHSEAGHSGTKPVTYDAARETLSLPDGSTRSVRERVWLLRERQLVGLTAETGPAVYLQTPKNQHELMKPKTGAAVPKRALDAFETEALAKLRSGDEAALQSSDRVLRVLGAIRARQECLSCHAMAEVGTLLGAFSYTLKAQSEAIPAEHRLKDRAGLSDAELGAVKVVESRGGRVIRAPGGAVTELQLTFARNREISDIGAGNQPWNPISRLLLHDSALSILGAFPDVRVLDVSNSLVSDAGLKAIAALKHLKKLDLSGTAVTPGGIAAFKEELPQCEVIAAVQPVP